MPELPEVETITRALAGVLCGRKVVKIATHVERLREPLEAAALRRITGAPFTRISRRAKFIVAENSAGRVLLMHLGMTGSLRIAEPGETRRKHDHAEFFLDNGQTLVYNDPRRFGLLKSYPGRADFDAEYSGLGVEPLEKEFSAAWLYARSRKAKLPVKPWIMKQEIVVGVGNIYACEALFASRISPLRPAESLTADECAELVKNIKAVLKQSIKNGGTTFSDYRQLNGEEGHFVQKLNVYGRAGEPCKLCGEPLSRTVQGGRSTFYCEHCQH